MSVCMGPGPAVDAAASDGFGAAAWSKGNEAQTSAQQRRRELSSGTGRVLCIQYEGNWDWEESFLRAASMIYKNVRKSPDKIRNSVREFDFA